MYSKPFEQNNNRRGGPKCPPLNDKLGGRDGKLGGGKTMGQEVKIVLLKPLLQCLKAVLNVTMISYGRKTLQHPSHENTLLEDVY